MKRLITHLILISLSVEVSSQSNFHKLYDFQNRNESGQGMIETNDEYVVFGLSSGGGTRDKFLKADTNGNVIFHKEFHVSNDWLFGGGKWFSGFYGFGWHTDSVENARDSHLFFVSDSLDSVRVITSDFGFNDQIKDAILLEDSSFIVVGSKTDTAFSELIPFVGHIDSLGTILWQKSIDSNNVNETVKNIETTLDGGYIVGGQIQETSAGWEDKFLIKLDSSGTIEWRKNYGMKNASEFVGHVTVCKDGGYALVGTITVVRQQLTRDANRGITKVDSVGNIVWEKHFGKSQYNESFQVARQLDDGGFICAGSSFRTVNGSDIPDINLMRLDSAGNKIWEKDYTFYGNESHDYVEDLQITSDGGFVMTGFVIPFQTGVTTRNDVFILKVDGNGVITSTNSGFQEVPAAWKIYPNPTNGQITIAEIEGLKRIHVFNVNGQKVQEFKPNTTAETNFEIQGKTGIYLLRLEMKDGQVSSSKIVKK